jgi:hypothetical protein
VPISPSPAVLAAFGAADTPTALAGGRGRTCRAGNIVLKPVDDHAEATWVATLARSVREDGVRIARPIAAFDGRWIVDGWSAWSWVSGSHSTTQWRELLAAAAAFHAVLAAVPRPEFIDRRADRWRTADRVAWGELPWVELRDTPHLAALVGARRPVTLRAQLVHCDLVGKCALRGRTSACDHRSLPLLAPA